MGRPKKDNPKDMDHVYQSPGIFNNVVLLDEASMHPGMNDPPETIQETIELSDYIFSKRLEQINKFIEKEKERNT